MLTHFSVPFGSDQIAQSASVKVLGVVIDPYLEWDRHVITVV